MKKASERRDRQNTKHWDGGGSKKQQVEVISCEDFGKKIRDKGKRCQARLHWKFDPLNISKIYQVEPRIREKKEATHIEYTATI